MSKVYIVSRTISDYDEVYKDEDFAFSSNEKAVAKAKELFAKDKKKKLEYLKDDLKFYKEELARNEKEFKEKDYDKYLKSAEFKERYAKFKAVHDGGILVDTSDSKYKDTLTKEDWNAINLYNIINEAYDRIERTESEIKEGGTEEFGDNQNFYRFFDNGYTVECTIQEIEVF